jgi:hypothetical protein
MISRTEFRSSHYANEGREMRDWIELIAKTLACILGGLLLIWAIMWSLRFFSNSVTTVTVEEVGPGIRCAKMVTADGAAISCWQVLPDQGER